MSQDRGSTQSLNTGPVSAAAATRVCLYLDPLRVFRWHCWLAEALSAIPGCDVAAAFAAGGRPLPASWRLLLDFERLVYRLNGSAALDAAGSQLQAQLRPAAAGEAGFDIVIDLAGHGASLPQGKCVLIPSCRGIAGEIGLIAAWADKESLEIDLYDSARPAAPWSAQPALGDPEILSRSLDNALSCAIRLIVKAVQRREVESIATAEAIGSGIGREMPHIAPARRAAGSLASKAAKFLGILVQGGKTWAVGWRFAREASLLDSGAATFSLIQDDRRRYYADPFPYRAEGRNFIFVEEYPYATGRGCISVFEIDGDGQVGSARPVLEEAYHLSYPFVFEHEGAIWMMPEAGASRGVHLYRAEQFPYKWKREACLIDGIEAYDSTLLHRAGKWWLFVCEGAWRSSGWDILSLFHSDALTGAWSAHPDNPLLVDPARARPAGAIFNHRGAIVRPVQDCSRRYGSAVSICAIDSLDTAAFGETLVGQIHAGGRGCHTYNRNAGIETVDIFGRLYGTSQATAFFLPHRR